MTIEDAALRERVRELTHRPIGQGEPQPQAHAEAFRCLLRFTRATSRQIPHVLG